MSFLPPGHDVLYYMFKYTFDNYDERIYASATVGPAKGYQIITGTGTYVGLDDGNGVITWNQVA